VFMEFLHAGWFRNSRYAFCHALTCQPTEPLGRANAAEVNALRCPDPLSPVHCCCYLRPLTGIRHIHAMPIRSSPQSLLAVLNLGFKHEPCLDMGFMGPHLFSTYLSLVSATLTAVVRDPGLNAYVCLARDLATASSLDNIMQVRLAAQ
jgi:hypothetical protein